MTSTHLNYKEKMFLLESRLHQLAKLRKVVIRSHFMDEFGEVLDEMRNMLVHFKLKIWDEEKYMFVPFIPLRMFTKKRPTRDIVDKLTYLFLQTIVREFDMYTYYDAESARDITEIANHNHSDLSDYKRYLCVTVSEPYFLKWKETRNKIFTPNTLFRMIPKQDIPCTTDACGICLELHRKIETVVCDCFHEFGQECFQKWASNCQKSARELTCPTCRREVQSTTVFCLVV